MRFRNILVLMMAVLALTSCAVSKKNSDKQDTDNTSTLLIGKKWQLIEVGGKAVAAQVNGKVPFLKLEEKRYSASAGCNGIGGELTFSANGKIKFAQGMSTMMACPDMSIEQALSKALITADNYTINNGILSLNKARMAPLAKFKLLEEKQNLSGTWELDYISGPRIAFEGLYPNRKPTMTFNTVDGKINGNSSCNNYNATFKTNGHQISFGPIMSTKMACEGSGEATFFSTLEKVNSYDVSENTLTFIMGDIAIMRFKRK
ncbi:META domain-containing protein [Sphingobacterium athyrii]|uniref:META domain-containing protein n=1 Tax=Sphingobacterium athyrii TaxID=2152717 RepID=A0A363NKV9_9SPHI|nr:META domain-containing protein [Sphingobacterium athyrii]PUV21412.1 META domain-containing protein [Sphingobacterium athyrii]